MALRWHDVTIPMRNGMAVWPGDTPFERQMRSTIAAGDGCHVSALRLSSHCGTHCDAPWHFEAEGARLHEVDTDLFFGDALVIEAPDAEAILAEHLAGLDLPPRVLFKTRNSALPADAPFQTDYAAVTPEAARVLVDAGVRLVGVDYLSVAPYADTAPTHHILLGAGVFVVEGLLLARVPPGTHPFHVMPLPLHDADGAPCRAFVGLPED